MINLQVRSGDGEILIRGSHGLAWSENLGRIDPDKFPCLSALLPYADTMFNSRQAERLRSEVSVQFIRDLLGEALTFEIEQLCRRVESSSHLYVWFVGD